MCKDCIHKTICKWQEEYEKKESGLNKPKETDSSIYLKIVCESYNYNRMYNIKTGL